MTAIDGRMRSIAAPGYYEVRDSEKLHVRPNPTAGLSCSRCGTTNLPRNIYWPKRRRVGLGFGQSVEELLTVLDPVCSDCHTRAHDPTTRSLP